jgi:hypothetical protein
MSINTIHFCAILEPINWFVNLFSNFEHFGVLFYFSSLVVLLPLIYFMSGIGKKISKSLDIGSKIASLVGAGAGVGSYLQGREKKAVEILAKPKDTTTENKGGASSGATDIKKAFYILSLLGINKDTIPETDLTLLAYVFLTLSFIIL